MALLIPRKQRFAPAAAPLTQPAGACVLARRQLSFTRMLSLVPAVAGFNAAGLAARGPALQPAAAAVVMGEKSAAIPFLNKPPALDGSMAGDQGFDPLGFSTTITELGGDLNYVREAELMHGRQAMLATVGFIFPAVFGKLPVSWTADVSVNPLEAQYQLPDAVFYQVVISIFIAEALRSRIVFGNKGNAPGDHGFDPFNFTRGMTPEQLKVMKTKEINNGRLAMIAVTGFFFQLEVTGHIWPLM
jgi:light-harvesting complex I chlorophyll a/b binding protein 1